MRRPTHTRPPHLFIPSRRTLVVVALATVAALTVWNVTSRASRAAASLGTTTPVWVAERDVAAGSVIGHGDVTREERPVAFVPDAATADDPVGLVVRADVTSGEVVVEDRLAEGGTGPVALIPSGWRGVAVTPFDPPPPVRPGSLVDVVVTLDATFGSSGGVLVDDAVVVHVADTNSTVTVAVPARHVPALAAAQTAGAVTLVLAG